MTAPTTRIWILGSGSKGNATLIEHGDARILIDAGFSLADLVARLRDAGVAPALIDDVIISHGHRDHVLGAAHGRSIYGWKIWATLGSVWQWRALRHAEVFPFSVGDTIELEHFRVFTASTPHDVDDSSAVVVEARATGTRIGICTDLGEATGDVMRLLRNVDALVLEANYEEELLQTGPYSERLRERVESRTGHLSNRDAALVIREVATPRLRTVVLAHVSQHNNTSQIALQRVQELVRGSAFHGTLRVAPQDEVLGPIAVGPDYSNARLVNDG